MAEVGISNFVCIAGSVLPAGGTYRKYPRQPGFSVEGMFIVPEPQIQIGTVVSMPFDENTYIVNLIGQNDCIVFDPGFEPEAIVDYLEQNALAPVAIVCTHGHSDHIAGNAEMKRRWPECPLVIGAGDAAKLTDPELNLSAPFGFPMTSPPADRTLREGEQFQAAGLEFDVFEAPGHSIGHIVLLCKQVQSWRLFGGDVLFAGSIGRTDFPDGSFDDLRDAIHKKLFTLPDDTIVYPGHGFETTIGREKRTNPFVGAPSGFIA
jgi:glyoxylase-like metal-dependent hydrolase (beta-lactamase superfamily II)